MAHGEIFWATLPECTVSSEIGATALEASPCGVRRPAEVDSSNNLAHGGSYKSGPPA
jgi:hypothetical protein